MKLVEMCGKRVNVNQIAFINVQDNRHDGKVHVLYRMSCQDDLNELFENHEDYLTAFEARGFLKLETVEAEQPEEIQTFEKTCVLSALFKFVYNSLTCNIKNKKGDTK